MKTRGILSFFLALEFCACLFSVRPAHAQATGSIVGSVVDPSGARVAGATVTVEESDRGFRRSDVTNDTGSFSFNALPPGNYQVMVESSGFSKSTQTITVNVGRDATVDFKVDVAGTSQSVSVQADAISVNLTDSKIDEIISRSDINDLPLNGRNAYELAKLVPAVTVTSAQTRNTAVAIQIAGRPSTSTRITVDGISIVDYTQGGTDQNFSQEIVQEFQVSASNMDPSSGISESGKVNIVTRSGGNQFNGNIFGFFRDNAYAAYPGLGHPVPLANPSNDPTIATFNDSQANPSFYRRQFGGTLSGPIIKDKLFWLASVDNTLQTAIAPFQPNLAAFLPLARLDSQPLRDLLMDYRLDWRPLDKHSFFVRYSRERGTLSKGTGFPDDDGFQYNRAYTAMLGWTAAWTTHLVSDFRLGFDNAHILQKPVALAAAEAQQYAPLLPYLGNITVSGTNMTFGTKNNIPNESSTPRLEFVPSFIYTHGSHTWKFGADIERNPYWLKWFYDSPYSGSVFTPAQATAAGISVPATYTTIGDLLQLPLASFAFGIGSDATLPSYNTNNVWVRHRYFFYGGDSWRVSRRLTLNLAANYSYEDGIVNWDEPKPQSLSKLFNGNLSATRRDNNNIAPVVGFAWDPDGKGKTVIRGGFGIYYGTITPNPTSRERDILAPEGDGYVSVNGTFINNPKPGGTGVLNFTTALKNQQAGTFRLADLLTYLPAIRASLQPIFTGTNTNTAVTNFDFFKSTGAGSSGGGSNTILMPDLTATYSMQSSIGFQHQFGSDLTVNASFVYDVVNHSLDTLDLNRFNRPVLSVGPPVVGGPVDSTLGPVLVEESGGKAVYKALLVSVNKRLSHRFQFGLAYTLQSDNATVTPLIDYNNRANNYGPVAGVPRQQLNFSATYQMPYGFSLALVNQMQSSLPLNVFLSNIDLNGDGTQSDLLPGLKPNSVNVGTPCSALPGLVASFNAQYQFPGSVDKLQNSLAKGIALPPGGYSCGDPSISQDVRLTKVFNFGEHARINLFAEVFNIFNIANLTYPSSAGNIFNATTGISTGFGQPTARFSNQFGSSGPRAGQFGFRLNF